MDKGIFEMSSAETAFAMLVLHEAMENLEKEKGNYYSLLKNYIFDFDKNDRNINSKLKNVIAFIQKYSKKVGERRAIEDLKDSLSKISKQNKEPLYYSLKTVCKRSSSSRIKKQIIKNV